MDSLLILESVPAHAEGATLVVDESGTIRFTSDQACHLLKYAADELEGQSVELLIPKRFRFTHIGQRLRFTDDFRTRPMGTGLPLFALCKNGSELPVDISLNPFRRGLKTLVLLAIRLREPECQLSEVT